MIVKESKLERDGLILNTLEVYLDNTTLLILQGYGAFIMCGALDVEIYNTPRMIERKVICAKAVGVKTIEELYQAKIFQACIYAEQLGWTSGMSVCEAFQKISTSQ